MDHPANFAIGLSNRENIPIEDYPYYVFEHSSEDEPVRHDEDGAADESFASTFFGTSASRGAPKAVSNIKSCRKASYQEVAPDGQSYEDEFSFFEETSPEIVHNPSITSSHIRKLLQNMNLHWHHKRSEEGLQKSADKRKKRFGSRRRCFSKTEEVVSLKNERKGLLFKIIGSSSRSHGEGDAAGDGEILFEKEVPKRSKRRLWREGSVSTHSVSSKSVGTSRSQSTGKSLCNSLNTPSIVSTNSYRSRKSQKSIESMQPGHNSVEYESVPDAPNFDGEEESEEFVKKIYNFKQDTIDNQCAKVVSSVLVESGVIDDDMICNGFDICVDRFVNKTEDGELGCRRFDSLKETECAPTSEDGCDDFSGHPRAKKEGKPDEDSIMEASSKKFKIYIRNILRNR